MGMNQHGVAHFANALYNAPWRPGLPHYPLKRTLLDRIRETSGMKTDFELLDKLSRSAEAVASGAQ